MSLPTVYHESKGLSVLEAMANAVPVVLPAHGTFPELIEATRGGVLHAPDDPGALADALRQLMADRERAVAMGRSGQQAVRRDYHAAAMAQKTLDLYRRVSGRQSEPCRAASG
jgi:glycosyltransferase involved in cell wall biosynthesis